MSARKRTIKERGAPVWVSAPVRRRLEELLQERTEELCRLVTMSEVIEGLLADRKADRP